MPEVMMPSEDHERLKEYDYDTTHRIHVWYIYLHLVGFLW